MKFLKYFAFLFIAALTLQSCNLLSAAGITSQGQPTKKVTGTLTSTTANSAVNVDHSQFSKLLKKHIDNEGFVDYDGFKNDEAMLDGYLASLANKDPNNDWSVQELLAFYINLYNAQTIKLILENPNVESIKDINKPWRKGRANVDGTMLSLAGIENGILRKMNEPRIHFAINCASISCPPLIQEAYTAAKINEQLEMVTKDFINSDKNDISANSAKLSSIFKFYPKDWKVAGEVDLIAYINKYSDTKLNTNATITYKNYDWGLNKQ